ncbi:MAG: acyltransferase [Paramuribaculum sp.]|jgi:hypothetical protein
MEYDFSDIAPYGQEEFKEKMAHLVNEEGFEHAVRYVMPDVDYPEFVKLLLSVKDGNEFQSKVMRSFLEMLVKRTTSGITCGGLDNISHDQRYTFMSNHRDIVLDASFLNYCFLTNDFPTSEVAIGNNLLIYDWITDLVKLNKSFIVKRNLKITQALVAARQLSAYIHYCINQKHESLWIAQREGRAKDSNDITQESLIKMIGLEGGGTLLENIISANIIPVAISYEYDPNDYLKATEFLLKRLDPAFKKSPHDDLLSMETGLLQPKGRVHFQIGRGINDILTKLPADTDKAEILKNVCSAIDCEIHSNYKIFPINYIAHDLLHHNQEYRAEYSEEELHGFQNYIEQQLDKVRLASVSVVDRNYMQEMMLTMYFNPLKNKIAASGKRCGTVVPD